MLNAYDCLCEDNYMTFSVFLCSSLTLKGGQHESRAWTNIGSLCVNNEARVRTSLAIIDVL